jgi:hypothetical protein
MMSLDEVLKLTVAHGFAAFVIYMIWRPPRVSLASLRELAAKADTLDLSWLQARLVGRGIDAREAARRVSEFRRLMILLAAGVPVRLGHGPLDETWRDAVDDTTGYAAFCHGLYDGYIAHRPVCEATGRQVALTVFAYGAAFGAEPPTDLWPVPGRAALARVRRQHWVSSPGWRYGPSLEFFYCGPLAGRGDWDGDGDGD